MKFSVKLIILFLATATPIFAFEKLNFANLDKTSSLLAIIIVVILLLMLLIYIFIIKRKYKLELEKQTQNNIYKFTYLKKNIQEAILDLKTLENKLKNSLLNSEELTNIINKILFKLKELEIYLLIKTNTITLDTSNFNLEQLIKNLHISVYDDKNQDSIKELNIITHKNISYYVITDKKMLENIFLLTALHQFKEHNYTNASVHIELLPNKNELYIVVPNLELTKDIKKVIDNNLEPIYNFGNQKYSGIYLHILNYITSKLNGHLKINIDDNIYIIEIKIPLKVEKMDSKYNLLLPKTIKKDKKILIVSQNNEISNTILHFLKEYGFEIEITDPINLAKIDNFEKIDILIADYTILKSLIADYIQSLKEKYHFRVVAIEPPKLQIQYKEEVVDYSLTKPILQSKIYKMLVELYQYDLDENKIKKDSFNNNFNNNRVLIADDDRVNLKLLRYLISSYNVEVVTATDGKEVLDILKKDKNFNLIILDSIMKHIDGFETVKKIRQNHRYNSIPVILHSSLSKDEYSIEDIFKLGFDSYLPKPFTKDKLISILDRYLRINKKKEGKNQEENLKGNKESLEEFLAIYGNSDKVIEKFIKENRREQALTILADLKSISLKLNQKSLLEIIEKIENNFQNSETIDTDLIYMLSSTIKSTREKAAKELGY